MYDIIDVLIINNTTMKNINSLRDEKTGRFKTTTNTTRYKMVQFNNKRMSDHARKLCIALNIPEIPKGFVIHHIDENKRNNDIDNLALMTTTCHNRIHSHEAWNKGLKKGDNKNWDNALFKQRVARDKRNLEKFKETNDLYIKLGSNQAVADKLGITRTGVIHRIKRYKELNK